MGTPNQKLSMLSDIKIPANKSQILQSDKHSHKSIGNFSSVSLMFRCLGGGAVANHGSYFMMKGFSELMKKEMEEIESDKREGCS